MKTNVPTLPDSELVDLGKAAGTGIAGALLGVIGTILRSRRSTARRIKGIEATVTEIKSEQAMKNQEHDHHRGVVTDAIAGLRDSVDKLDAKLESASQKQDEIAEAVAYIRGRLNGKHDHG